MNVGDKLLQGAMNAAREFGISSETIKEMKETGLQESIQKIEAEETLQSELKDINPPATKLAARMKSGVEELKTRRKDAKESVLKRAEFENAANDFSNQQGNQRFKPVDLVALRMMITPDMSRDQVLVVLKNLIQETKDPESPYFNYKDPSMIDKMLEFLETVDTLNAEKNPNATKLTPEQKDAISSFRREYNQMNAAAIKSGRVAEAAPAAPGAAPAPPTEAAKREEVDALYGQSFKQTFDKLEKGATSLDDILKKTEEAQHEMGKRYDAMTHKTEVAETHADITVGQLIILVRSQMKFIFPKRWELIQKKIGEIE